MKNICLLILICLFSMIFVSCGHDEIADIDLESSISWSSLSSYAMNWYDAQDYCRNLRERGHDDWHLPTIEELDTVIYSCFCLHEDHEECYCDYNIGGDRNTYYNRLGGSGPLWSASSCACIDIEDIWTDIWTGTTATTFLFEEHGIFLSNSYIQYADSFEDTHHFVSCIRSKCANGYFWNNGKCETAQTRTADCTNLPQNASWNTVSQITQTWNGYRWLPTDKSRHNEEPSTTECRFKCNADSAWDGKRCDKPYNDPATGLFWSRRSPADMKWKAASTYCDSLSEEGFSDWHLPTISELRTLIQNCPGTETGGECKVSDSCLSLEECHDYDLCECNYDPDESGKYSKLSDTNVLWSSSMLQGDDDLDYRLWVVDFRDGYIGSEDMNSPLYFRCVRSNN